VIEELYQFLVACNPAIPLRSFSLPMPLPPSFVLAAIDPSAASKPRETALARGFDPHKLPPLFFLRKSKFLPDLVKSSEGHLSLLNHSRKT